MAPPLLALDDVHLTFGGTPLLTGASLSVAAGDRICLVGRNGSGKSTLLKIAAGFAEPDRGERFVHPQARAMYLTQEVDFAGHDTTFDFVAAALGPTDDPHRARRVLLDLGLTGEEEPSRLSGGEARRAALARVLAPDPDILLLDEPTNHLDLPAIEWLEGKLAASRAALVLVSHDRRFLETLSRRTVWLDRGTTRTLERGFAHFESWRDELLEQEELERHKLDRKIAREQSWMHGGVTARRKRNVRRVAELARMRTERREARRSVGNVRFEASEGQISGRLVTEATGISKSFEATTVVSDLSLRIFRGDRLGLVGPNGAGKTTLVKLLTGALEPDTGTVRLGTGLELVLLDQRRDELDPGWTIIDALTGGRGDWVEINGQRRHVASYIAEFLFLPEQARSPVRVLSGGERARLMLARALAKPSNVLVLDEPTNDLDLETLDLLQDLIADYKGTVILVSHDRDFLDRLVTSVLAAEPDGRWIEYAGGYTDMLAQRRGADLARRPTETAAKPALNRETAEPAPATSDGRRKLSFKDKHALATLPAEMERLANEIAAAEKKLADPELFRRAPAEFQSLTLALSQMQAQLAAAEDRWLELEALREEIEGQ
jgi:ATP-binding cassette subfamily F protein uup